MKTVSSERSPMFDSYAVVISALVYESMSQLVQKNPATVIDSVSNYMLWPQLVSMVAGH